MLTSSKHTHTLTHIHTCMHMHIQTHRHTDTYKQAHTHTHIHSYTSTHIHTDTHTHTPILRGIFLDHLTMFKRAIPFLDATLPFLILFSIAVAIKKIILLFYSWPVSHQLFLNTNSLPVPTVFVTAAFLAPEKSLGHIIVWMKKRQQRLN